MMDTFVMFVKNWEELELIARPEILVLFLVLWLLFRRETAERQPDRSLAILQEKFERGEVSRETYNKILEGTHETVR